MISNQNNFKNQTNPSHIIMKKFILISLFVLLASISAKAQFTTFSSADNEEYAVFEVEDMESYEIKDYNSWTKQGFDHKYSLLYINAYRAQINLINSPATIIDYHLYTEEDESGAAIVDVELINSTPKTIKEITFEFEFKNGSTPIYDIKTGDSYMVIKFTNLRGRTKSDIYSEVAESILKCYHRLKCEDATYIKKFYNKKATSVNLHSVKIKYTDGSISNKVAIFDNGYLGNNRLLFDGPLSPYIKYVDYLMKKEKATKEPSTNSNVIVPSPPQKSDEVFKSAAHMPSFPGGDAALMKYLNDHMIYPEQAKIDGIQGKVIVQFVVKKDGTIGEVKVSRGVHPLLDKEAIRLVLNLPSFSPGRNAVGETIDVWYTLPVTFKLPGF